MAQPSKRLIKEITGQEHDSYMDYVEYNIIEDNNYMSIYDFSHECKSFAIKNKYALFIEIHYMNSVIISALKMYSSGEKIKLNKCFQSEEEAVFEMCEYIMDRIKEK